MDPGILAMVVAGLMGIQATLGLIFSGQYRDVVWIRETWFGNDWVTLVVAVPALVLASRIAARGSSRAHVVRLGLLAYAVYNYAFYLFGAALNVFFPVYVACYGTAPVDQGCGRLLPLRRGGARNRVAGHVG